MNVTKEELHAGLQVIRAVAETIRELASVPSGVLYAQMASMFSLQEYNKIIDTLKGAGLVVEDVHHVLRWVEPSSN